MAYNSKYTGAQVEALLDRAGEAPQTYDIGWLIDLYEASEDGSVTLTETQFNEIKAAADAGKVFTGSGTVWRAIHETIGSDEYIGIVSAPTSFEWDSALQANLVVIRVISVSSDGQVYGGNIGLVSESALSNYAKTSAIPSKTSQLTNDSGFITADEITMPKKTVVKTVESNIGYGNGYTLISPSIELAADKFHIVGKCQGLTLTLPDGADTDGQEYCCQFYVGTTSFTLTLPESVYWQNGEAPEFQTNTCCQLVIVNNCATIGVFKASS